MRRVTSIIVPMSKSPSLFRYEPANSVLEGTLKIKVIEKQTFLLGTHFCVVLFRHVSDVSRHRNPFWEKFRHFKPKLSSETDFCRLMHSALTKDFWTQVLLYVTRLVISHFTRQTFFGLHWVLSSSLFPVSSLTINEQCRYKIYPENAPGTGQIVSPPPPGIAHHIIFLGQKKSCVFVKFLSSEKYVPKKIIP